MIVALIENSVSLSEINLSDIDNVPVLIGSIGDKNLHCSMEWKCKEQFKINAAHSLMISIEQTPGTIGFPGKWPS